MLYLIFRETTRTLSREYDRMPASRDTYDTYRGLFSLLIVCLKYTGTSYFRGTYSLKYTSKIRMIKLENVIKFGRKNIGNTSYIMLKIQSESERRALNVYNS